MKIQISLRLCAIYAKDKAILHTDAHKNQNRTSLNKRPSKRNSVKRIHAQYAEYNVIKEDQIALASKKVKRRY